MVRPSSMVSWNVYVFFHGSAYEERSIRRVGRVEADDELLALSKARELINGMRFRKRFGGIDVRRSDLPTLAKILGEEEKRKHGANGWQQQFGRRKRGRPSKEVRAALERGRDSSSEVGEDWSGFDSETSL